MISQTYKLLAWLPQDPFIKHTYMVKWDKTLGRELPLLTWQIFQTQAHQSSICTNYKENAYKILIFWYHTHDLLHTIYPLVSDRCWRCTVHNGTLSHIFWECSLINSFWTQVSSLLASLLGKSVPLDPLTYLFETSTKRSTKPISRLVSYVLTVARFLIPTR